ncbi:unnamed protein product [Nezara viridula]|uniref:UBC core domain-containing protein n=1 Tax=Nezara viridula TaxID=85310 RepID=A0A9P0E5B8_NEZVI|nr:unnamed protein product [Nezara viridula]
MTTLAKVRLMKDLRRIQIDPPPGISGCPSDDNLFEWDAIIVGPLDTLYENGIFKLHLFFSENYPIDPPLVKFISRIFHPNVFHDGMVCMNTLVTLWTPALDVAAVLTSIQSLLAEPYFDSPANETATVFYTQNKKGYAKMVRECVDLTLQ